MDGDVLVDGRADQRVHERHRRLVGEHLGADQLARGPHRGGVVQAGELGHERQRGRVAEHGGRPRDRGRARLSRPIRTSTAREAARGAIASTAATCAASGAHPLGTQCLGQLDQHQRVPARRAVARAREHLVRALAEQRGARALAQRLRPQGDRERIAAISPIRCAWACRSNGRVPHTTVTRSPSSRRTR